MEEKILIYKPYKDSQTFHFKTPGIKGEQTARACSPGTYQISNLYAEKLPPQRMNQNMKTFHQSRDENRQQLQEKMSNNISH